MSGMRGSLNTSTRVSDLYLHHSSISLSGQSLTCSAALQVLNRRKLKGDEAFAATDFALAHRYLDAAYASVQKIKNTVWNAGNDGNFHYISSDRSVSPNLVTDILVKLTIAAVELHDFDQVHRWAAAIFSLEPMFIEAYTVDWCRDSVAWVRETTYTAHYCRAVALQKQGEIDGASQHFEKALVCDDACHATYYQLDNLRRHKAQEILNSRVEEIETLE